MNKLEKLIHELCPEGVPRRRLDSLCKIKTGKRDANHGSPAGKYHFFTCSRDNLYIDDYSFDTEALLVAGNGEVGAVKYFKGKFDAYQRTYVLTNFDGINVFYLLHFISGYLIPHLNALSNNSTISYIKLDMLGGFRIPVPPIEIQEEIVKILDSFTSLESELKSELEARKKQYAYYRESLFDSNDKGVQIKSIDQVSTIWRGRRFVKDDILEEGIPAIHYGEIYTKYGLASAEAFSYLDPELASRLRFAKTGDVILVSAGETIEDIGKSFVWLGVEDVVIHDACYGLRSESVDPSYMVHFFNTHNFRSQLQKYISTSKISSISTEKLGKVFIPVPSISLQKEIAKQLDKFDALVAISLPAEISARKKQYEYYRDKLLAFKELESA